MLVFCERRGILFANDQTQELIERIMNLIEHALVVKRLLTARYILTILDLYSYDKLEDLPNKQLK